MLNYVTKVVNKFTENKGPKPNPCVTPEQITKGKETVPEMRTDDCRLQ